MNKAMGVCTAALAVVLVALFAMYASVAESSVPGPCRKQVGRDEKGRAAFFDADGKPYFACGIAGTRLDAKGYQQNMLAKYGNSNTWAKVARKRLADWGFNAHGISVDGLVKDMFVQTTPGWLSVSWEFAHQPDQEKALARNFPNVFHPEFEAFAEETTHRKYLRHAGDGRVVGLFLDNEMNWGGKYDRWSLGLYDTVAELPTGHSAKNALVAFLASRGISDPMKADERVREEFVALVAERYFSIVHGALKKENPSLLDLGVRFAGLYGAPDVVWKVCAKYCDVVSFNCYPTWDPRRNNLYPFWKDSNWPTMDLYDAITFRHKQIGRPLMVTEWAFLVYDESTGTIPRWGDGARLRSQEERAEATSFMARTLASHPDVIGWNAFWWTDFAKDDKPVVANYGIVDIEDNPRPVAHALAEVQCNIAKYRNLPRPMPFSEAEFRHRDLADFRAMAIKGARPVTESRARDLARRVRVELSDVNGTNGTFCVAREVRSKWQELDDELRELLIWSEGGAGDSRFEIVERMTFVPGADISRREIVSLKNIGRAMLDFGALWAFPERPEKGWSWTFDGSGFRQRLLDGWMSIYWRKDRDGTGPRFGLASPTGSMNYSHFFIVRDGEMSIYVKYAPIIPVSLGPGEIWKPQTGTVRLHVISVGN